MKKLLDDATRVIDTLGFRIGTYLINNPDATNPRCEIIEVEYQKLEAMKNALPKLLAVVEALKAAKINHYSCEEDCWYSCPKSKDGCCDADQGDECNCGADKHNTAIDKALKDL